MTTRRRRTAWPVFMAGLLAGGFALAQYQVIGGHALDANTRVGDYGINSRVARNQALSIAQPTYAARASNAGRYRTTAGLGRDRYFTTSAPPSSGGAMAYRPQGGYGYTPPTGAINADPLCADLYRPMHATPVIQTASGGVTTYSSGISRPLYRPVR